MPILPAEPDVYPSDLWGMIDGHPVYSFSNPDMRWMCLHTKPRQEKETARALRKLGLTYYLPMGTKIGRTPQGRRTKSVIPLFPGYLFLYGDSLARLSAFQGNRLVNVLEPPSQADLVRDLRQTYRIRSSGMEVIPETTYPIGSWVRVMTGPLMGLEGIVHRRGKEDAFTAMVNFLGQGSTVKLNDTMVELIDPPPSGSGARRVG